MLATVFFQDRGDWWPEGTPPYYVSPFFHYHANTLGVQEVRPNLDVRHCIVLSSLLTSFSKNRIGSEQLIWGTSRKWLSVKSTATHICSVCSPCCGAIDVTILSDLHCPSIQLLASGLKQRFPNQSVCRSSGQVSIWSSSKVDSGSLPGQNTSCTLGMTMTKSHKASP